MNIFSWNFWKGQPKKILLQTLLDEFIYWTKILGLVLGGLVPFEFGRDIEREWNFDGRLNPLPTFLLED